MIIQLTFGSGISRSKYFLNYENIVINSRLFRIVQATLFGLINNPWI